MVGLVKKILLSSIPEMHPRTPEVGYSHWVETDLAGFNRLLFPHALLFSSSSS
jgi:hypothetical protein